MKLTDISFSQEVEHSRLPVLVDFWAPWCGPCVAMAPVLEEMARELSGRVRVMKLNIDENPVAASRFAVQSIPSLLVFEGGREIDRIVGAQPKTEVMRRLARFL